MPNYPTTIKIKLKYYNKDKSLCNQFQASAFLHHKRAGKEKLDMPQLLCVDII